MYTEDELKIAVQRTANVYAKIANRTMGTKLKIPVDIVYDIELESKQFANYAAYAHGDINIGINTTLLIDNFEHILNQTIPHEIAHMVQYQRFTSKGVINPDHGVFWAEVMRKFGIEPLITHDFDVTKAIARYKEHKNKQKQKKQDEE